MTPHFSRNIPHSSLNELPETPFYYYDTHLLQRTLENIKSCIAQHDDYVVHYAIKANTTPTVLSAISSKGFGADCVSGGEIKVAINAGFDPGKIVFAGVGKTDKEIAYALEVGIFCFNVESLPEIDAINEIAVRKNLKARLAIRVNPNVDAHSHPKITTGLNENKFGIDIPHLLPAIRRIQSLEGVELIGLHFHIGSQITDLRVFETLCERINELQTELELHDVHLRHINVGGGLGINYKEPHLEKIAPFREYFEVFGKNLFLRPGQTLHFELGRSVVAQCGTLLSRVVYVKQGSHRKFVILDAGFSDLARVAMYGAYHHIENLGSSDMSARPLEYCDIVGPICESSDVFAQGRLINQCRRGDVVAIRSAGAYGITMASTYNCRPLPASFSDLDFTFNGGKLR